MHEIKKLNREALKFEYNVHTQRLFPWGVLNAPFEGSWILIDPKATSEPHSHHDYEIFIAIKGIAFIVSEGKKTLFNPGDVVHFTPGTVHSVVNDSDEPFEMYGIWWDIDMTNKFKTIHEQSAITI